jgi:hypothetical protein
MTAGTVREKNFERDVRYRTSCPVSQGRAIDMHPDSDRVAAQQRTGRAADEMPRWVKIFGVVGAIAVAAFAVLHIAGGGMGHMAHGNMDAHSMSAGHHRDVP